MIVGRPGLEIVQPLKTTRGQAPATPPEVAASSNESQDTNESKVNTILGCCRQPDDPKRQLSLILNPKLEKHGGLWIDTSVETGWLPYFERYDAVSCRIAAVFRKQSLFKAVMFEKLDGGTQWRLPFWTECRPEALFESGPEAIRHVETLIANHSD